MKHALYSALFWAAAAAFAHAGDFDPITFPANPDPDGHGGIKFAMPSGNIDCQFYPAYFKGEAHEFNDETGHASLECERREPTHIDIQMGELSAPQINKADWDGDNSMAGAPVFPYGRSWKAGPFECDSRADGLVCTRTDGHGFRVSKAKAEAF